MRSWYKRLPVILGLGLIAFTPAQAAVSILGGGLAQSCSQLTFEGREDIEVLNLCNRALSEEMLIGDDRAGTLVNRGVVQLRRRQLAEAQTDFDAALALSPRMGEAYVNRGAALIAAHRYREGIVQIDRGLEFDPDEPAKAYYNRALAHEGLDDLLRAYQDYSRAAELEPDWQAPRTELARFTVRPK